MLQRKAEVLVGKQYSNIDTVCDHLGVHITSGADHRILIAVLVA